MARIRIDKKEVKLLLLSFVLFFSLLVISFVIDIFALHYNLHKYSQYFWITYDKTILYCVILTSVVTGIMISLSTLKMCYKNSD